MASTDHIILEHLLQDRKVKIATDLSDSNFFELFVSEQILKNYDLSYEEIESGIVGNGNDGGIDSIYAFINGNLITEDSDFNHLRSNITIDLLIIQAKTSSSYSETAIHKLISSTKDLFNFDNPINNLTQVYDRRLLSVVSNFRDAFLELAIKFPKLNISYHYATKGDDVHPNVLRRVKTLEETVKYIFSECEFSFEFIGSRKLLNLARQSPTEPLQLKVSETPISTGKIASICLVQLKDFYNFITDDNGQLRRGLFEANVRDYQGSVEVNKAIAQTLKGPDTKEEFWWLNNGVTIVASEAPLNGKILTIKDAQIVNGLQTSMRVGLAF